MRLPRPRITIAGLMLLVAVLAPVALGVRERWLRAPRPDETDWVSGEVDAMLTRAGLPVWKDRVPGYALGQPIPMTINYDLNLVVQDAPPGTEFLAWCEVGLEDAETGEMVMAYTFDVPLVVGGRQHAAGSFPWVTTPARPGLYWLIQRVRYRRPTGEWRGVSSGAFHVEVHAPDRSPTRAALPGGTP